MSPHSCPRDWGFFQLSVGEVSFSCAQNFFLQTIYAVELAEFVPFLCPAQTFFMHSFTDSHFVMFSKRIALNKPFKNLVGVSKCQENTPLGEHKKYHFLNELPYSPFPVLLETMRIRQKNLFPDRPKSLHCFLIECGYIFLSKYACHTVLI